MSWPEIAHPQTLRKLGDRALEAGIVERDQATAALANDVMMVLAAGLLALEAGLPVADLDALGEAVLDKLVEHAVDAGSSGGTSRLAQGRLDLPGCQRARLLREQLDHPLPRPAALETRVGEHLVHMLAPRCSLLRNHSA